MENRIRDVVVLDKRLDPAEAEVHVAVYPERLTPGTEVKGRLMGPSCAYATTVEVAYHLRPVARAEDHLVVRAVMPEPCLWDPQTPFLYQGPLELWEDGKRCEQVRLSHGLRQIRLAGPGLRVNGQAVAVHGTSRLPASEVEARALHERGINLLLVSDARDYFNVWSLADQFGFFVLARAVAPSVFMRWKQESHARASLLGWVFTLADFEDVVSCYPQSGDSVSLARVGIELTAPPPQPLPDRAAFVLCEQELLPALVDVALPKFVREKDDTISVRAEA